MGYMTPLEEIQAEIVNDPANKTWREAGFAPLYTASEHSKIVIVGQAPGKKAQDSAMPWNDASGVELRKWLGVSDKQFYNPDLFALLPMDFYYPGKGVHGDLPPRKAFAPKWHPRILANMQEVELTILIGSYAQKYYLSKSAKGNLTQTVAAFEEYLPIFFPLVHPSPLNFRWQTKNPWFRQELVPILQERVKKILG
jgi:uracil-DNA glycosylase